MKSGDWGASNLTISCYNGWQQIIVIMTSRCGYTTPGRLLNRPMVRKSTTLNFNSPADLKATLFMNTVDVDFRCKFRRFRQCCTTVFQHIKHQIIVAWLLVHICSHSVQWYIGCCLSG